MASGLVLIGGDLASNGTAHLSAGGGYLANYHTGELHIASTAAMMDIAT